jgi:hypothetical protein
MPLPPLAQNNTDRAWLKYTSVGVNHEIVFRFPSSTTQANIVTAVTAFANSMKSSMSNTDSFLSLRHQDSGSTLSFPLSFTAIAGTATPSTDQDNNAKFIAISGRSLNGYRVKLTFFTPNTGDSAKYRVAGSGSFATAVAAMTTQPVAIDGAAVVWNSYTNVGYNAYWQRQFRG